MQCMFNNQVRWYWLVQDDIVFEENAVSMQGICVDMSRSTESKLFYFTHTHMLDPKYIRENLEYMKKVIADKRSNAYIDDFAVLYDQVKELQQQEQELNTQKNQAAKEQNTELGKEIKTKLQELAEILPEKQKQLQEILRTIPNTYSEDTPLGADDSENVVLRSR